MSYASRTMKLNNPILALACDYDETLACNGQINPSTVEALVRLKASGKKIVLVTGRELDELLQVCPEIKLFDLVVAENGAVLFSPETGQSRALAGRPPEGLLKALRQRGVQPLSTGQCIMATVLKHYAVVLETIAEMKLDREVILNRSSVMVLPAGVHKGTGLKLALEELNVPLENVVGIGDAENDDAFLSLCGSYVAVGNAIPSIQEAADVVTDLDHGAGVTQVIESVLAGEFSRN